MTNSLRLSCKGRVGFIVWLDASVTITLRPRMGSITTIEICHLLANAFSQVDAA